MLTLARAVLTAPKQQNHRRVALQFRQLAHRAGGVGEFEIGEGRAGDKIGSHGGVVLILG
jgi:hypothetical protein